MTRPCNPRAEASPPAKRALLEQGLSGNAGVPPLAHADQGRRQPGRRATRGVAVDRPPLFLVHPRSHAATTATISTSIRKSGLASAVTPISVLGDGRFTSHGSGSV